MNRGLCKIYSWNVSQPTMLEWKHYVVIQQAYIFQNPIKEQYKEKYRYNFTKNNSLWQTPNIPPEGQKRMDQGEAPELPLLLLRFVMDWQKEEKESLSSLGRGSVRGGSTPWWWLLPVLEEDESASAGCCLLRPSIMKENAPKVRQLWSRAWGAPVKHK